MLAHVALSDALDNALVLIVGTAIGGGLLAGGIWLVRRVRTIAHNSNAVTEVVMGKKATETTDKIPSLLERFDAQDDAIEEVEQQLLSNVGDVLVKICAVEKKLDVHMRDSGQDPAEVAARVETEDPPPPSPRVRKITPSQAAARRAAAK